MLSEMSVAKRDIGYARERTKRGIGNEREGERVSTFSVSRSQLNIYC